MGVRLSRAKCRPESHHCHFAVQLTPTVGTISSAPDYLGNQIMAGSLQKYPSPLSGFEDAAPLPTDLGEDGKSFVNPPREGLSDSYEKFTAPLDNGRRGGFDIHIYHFQNNPAQVKYAKDLWERIRREFPELRVYRFWDKPIGGQFAIVQKSRSEKMEYTYLSLLDIFSLIRHLQFIVFFI
ncbi:putative 21.2 kDa protein like [Verticillium longisporum]|nr:putative 21.2 kDa protein like [Verticillium longisporum]